MLSTEKDPLINANALRFHHLTIKLLVYNVMVISSRQRSIAMWRLWWAIDRWILITFIHRDHFIDVLLLASPLTQTCNISVSISNTSEL